METGKLENAKIKLKEIVINKDDVFYQQAQWYLGLSYLKSNENKNAVNIFNIIVKENSFYKAQAKEILAKINK
jgi:hypothetical protein